VLAVLFAFTANFEQKNETSPKNFIQTKPNWQFEKNRGVWRKGWFAYAMLKAYRFIKDQITIGKYFKQESWKPNSTCPWSEAGDWDPWHTGARVASPISHCRIKKWAPRYLLSNLAAGCHRDEGPTSLIQPTQKAARLISNILGIRFLGQTPCGSVQPRFIRHHADPAV
jgi:hypothetical protein